MAKIEHHTGYKWESMTLIPFDPTQSFGSVEEAVDLCRNSEEPEKRARAVIDANLDECEYGFVGDFIKLFYAC